MLILMALVKLVRGKALSEVAALGCMGLIGIALAIAVWSFLGWRQGVIERERPPAAASVEQSRPASLLDSRQFTATSNALVWRMAAQLLTALGVWLVVVVVISLAGAVFLRDTRYALNTGLLRFGILFWKSFLSVLAADVVLWLAHFHWVGDEPGPGSFSKVAAIVFGALPVLVGFLGLTSLFRHRDPWEYLPGGPPFELREFAAKHPQLRIETVGALGGDVVAVTCGSSPLRVIYSERDLRQSELIWEKFSDAGEPARLGGPPPFPSSRCLARIQIRRPDWEALSDEELDRDVDPPDMRTVRYVYHADSARISEVTQHFLDWAKKVGPEPNLYGYWMEVTAGGKTWTIEIRGVKHIVDDVYVEYSDRRAPGHRAVP